MTEAPPTDRAGAPGCLSSLAARARWRRSPRAGGWTAVGRHRRHELAGRRGRPSGTGARPRRAIGVAITAALVTLAIPTASAVTHAPARRAGGLAPLPTPARLAPFPGAPSSADGQWRGVGRPVGGRRAVYETTLHPPGLPGVVAGVAWMDTHLLNATLYSGSVSPGGLFWKYTAPIAPLQAKTLVAAFNGGFKMPASDGGYYSEGKLVDPLRAGAASLVIYKNGRATVGAWGRDVTMAPSVMAVRQNLGLLVDGGSPTALASTPEWLTWGATCAADTCAGPGIEDQWRSGLGVTRDGALIYVAGPSLSPDALAELLVRAGAVRAMELDINPYWPTFATYAPTPSSAAAGPANGTDLLADMTGQPARFFTASWARDFITMSAR